MKARDLFGLGVRLLGVWLICRCSPYVSSFIDIKLYPANEKALDGAAANLIYASIDLSLAIFFLGWTHVVVGWTYGDRGGMKEVWSEGTGSSADGPDQSRETRSET